MLVKRLFTLGAVLILYMTSLTSFGEETVVVTGHRPSFSTPVFGLSSWSGIMPNATPYGSTNSPEAYAAMQQAMQEAKKQCAQQFGTAYLNACKQASVGLYQEQATACNMSSAGAVGVGVLAGGLAFTVVTGGYGAIFLVIAAGSGTYAAYNDLQCNAEAEWARDYNMNTYCPQQTKDKVKQNCGI